MYLLHVSGSLLYLIVPEYNISLTATHRSIYSTKCGFRLPTFQLLSCLEKDFCISGVEGMPNCPAPTQNQDFGLEMG